MDLKDIVSISGKAGLYKIVAQGKNSIFVESLSDKRRFPAYASDKISSLGDISIYTTDDDLKLTDAYELMFNNLDGKPALSHKEKPNKLREYILSIIPNYDSDKVYDSDVKKLFQWYNTLHKSGLLITEEKSKEETTEKKISKVASNKASSPAKISSKPKASKVSASKKSSISKTGSSRGK